MAWDALNQDVLKGWVGEAHVASAVMEGAGEVSTALILHCRMVMACPPFPLAFNSLWPALSPADGIGSQAGTAQL